MKHDCVLQMIKGRKISVIRWSWGRDDRREEPRQMHSINSPALKRSLLEGCNEHRDAQRTQRYNVQHIWIAIRKGDEKLSTPSQSDFSDYQNFKKHFASNTWHSYNEVCGELIFFFLTRYFCPAQYAIICWQRFNHALINILGPVRCWLWYGENHGNSQFVFISSPSLWMARD